jgi:hypothetical protein
MQYPSLPAGAFLAAVLVLIPLPWHWRARNIGTLAIIGWLFIVNMIYGINAIIWAGNVDNPAPVWCDISELHIDAQPSATKLNVSFSDQAHYWCKHCVAAGKHVCMQAP